MQPPPEYQNNGDGRLDINPRPALLQRHPRRSAPDEAIDGLQQKLAVSTVIYEQHGDAGRAGAGRALREVIDYLRDQGLPTPALLPLFDLAVAMDELDHNVVVPLLAPKRKAGRPRKANADARTDAFLAVVMECCVRHYRDDERRHDFLEPAKQLATKMINQSALGLNVTKDRMEDVREAVTSQGTDEAARSIYDTFIRDAETNAPVLEWARAFVSTGWLPQPKVSG